MDGWVYCANGLRGGKVKAAGDASAKAVDLSGRDFLLPLKAQVFMRVDRERSRNDIEYRLYQKFSADATVTFDTPDVLPEDQRSVIICRFFLELSED